MNKATLIEKHPLPLGEWVQDIGIQVQFLTEHLMEYTDPIKWYIGWMDENKKWHDKSYFPHELNRLDVSGKEDMFISLLPFKRDARGIIRRKTNQIAGQQIVWVDLDFNCMTESVDFIINVLPTLNDIPKPSAILMSGNGCWLFWRIDPLTVKQHQKIIKEINWRLREYHADISATNLNRYHRIIGTVNSKSNQRVQMQVLSEEIYSLEALVEALGKTVDWVNEERKKTTKKKQSKPKENKIKNLFTLYSLHSARLDDLDKWLEMRHYNIEGSRNDYLHIVGNEIKRMQYGNIDNIEDILFGINDSFVNPLPLKEVQKIIKSVYSNNYQYKNTTIIEKLGIKEHEQVNFKTILGKEEKKRRDRIRHKEAYEGDDMATYQKKRKDEMINKSNAIKMLLGEGKSMAEVLGLLGISKATYYRLLKL